MVDFSRLLNRNVQLSESERLFRLKRSILITLGVILFIIVARVLYIYLNSGYLIAASNVQGSSLKIVSESSGSIKTITNYSGQTLSLYHGDYIVMLEKGDRKTTSFVSIVARKTIKKDMTLSDTMTPELTAAVNPIGFTVDSSNLWFVDANDSGYDRLDNLDNLSQVSSNIKFLAVKWVANGYGIAEAVNGQFYVLDNGSVTAFESPTPKNITNFVVDQQHEIYMTSGDTIYYGTPTTGFSVFKQLSYAPSFIDASGGVVVVGYNPGGGNNQQRAVLSSFIGSQTFTHTGDSIYAASLSPDGQRLVFTTAQRSELITPELGLISVLPQANINNLHWLSNSSLLYSVNSELWQYSSTDNVSRLILNTTSGKTLDYITAGPTGQIYVAIVASVTNNTDSQIFKVVANKVVSVAGLFPSIEGSCILGFSSFSSPTVQIFSPPTFSNCIPVAKAFILKNGLAANSFNYKITSVPPDEPIN